MEHNNPNPKDLVGSQKVSLSCVPAIATLHEAFAMMEGSEKYGPFNWRDHPVNARIYYDACLRHMSLWFEGEEYDLKSGAHHLGHARACLGILLDALEGANLYDDRPIPNMAYSVELDGLNKTLTETAEAVTDVEVEEVDIVVDEEVQEDPKPKLWGLFLFLLVLLFSLSSYAQQSGLPAPSVASGSVGSFTSVTIPSDGVHAGLLSMACNTTNPATVATSQGWAGSTASASCTPYYVNVPALAPAVNQTFMFPAPTSSYSQGTWVNFWHEAVASVNVTAQSANIAATTILTTPATAGYYRVCMTTTTTRAATTSSTMPAMSYYYTDANDSVQKLSGYIGFNQVAGGNGTYNSSSGCSGPLYVAASTAIQYQTTGYASSGATTMQYDLQVSVETR